VQKLFSVRKICTFLVYSSLFMITMFLPFSAQAIIVLVFSVISLLFMPYMMYACLFCVTLSWLFEMRICLSFLAAIMWNGFCNFMSSSLMARSVSIIRLVQ
jgi:hypothetical protein